MHQHMREHKYGTSFLYPRTLFFMPPHSFVREVNTLREKFRGVGKSNRCLWESYIIHDAPPLQNGN